MLKTIKAKYRNGKIEPMEELAIPDNIDIIITIDTDLITSEKSNDRDWHRWRGILKGTSALRDHEQEHKEEIDGEKSP